MKEKRARLVIRNLPFQANEENLKEHFEKFGEILDVKVLKKEDGKLVGCGFVQFKLVQKAAKARHHLNGKTFLGREIEVDFALAKNKFESEAKEETEVKVKEEPVGDEEIKEEPVEVDEIKDETEEEVLKEEQEAEESDNDDDKEIELDESDESEEEKEEEPVKKPKFESNDVTEGKTIFIKNVPFSATNEDLKQCMSQFGPLYYALICIDKYTEHSKGTAFVKFRNAEDAQKALEAGTELTLLGNILDCHRALGRDELRKKDQAKKEEKSAPKDSRNLYLVKEGGKY